VECSLHDFFLSVYRECNQTYTGVVKAIACTGCLVIIDGAHNACKTSVDCAAASADESVQIEKVKNRASGEGPEPGDGSSEKESKAETIVGIIVTVVILLCCCVGCISFFTCCCCESNQNVAGNYQQQQQQQQMVVVNNPVGFSEFQAKAA
jgi:hypothetical protein